MKEGAPGQFSDQFCAQNACFDAKIAKAWCRNHISFSVQAVKGNQVCQWLKKAYQDLEDKMVNQDYLVNQVHK